MESLVPDRTSGVALPPPVRSRSVSVDNVRTLGREPSTFFSFFIECLLVDLNGSEP
jgi:hypothetical protein